MCSLDPYLIYILNSVASETSLILTLLNGLLGCQLVDLFSLVFDANLLN